MTSTEYASFRCMKAEFKEIVNDNKLHPDHRNDYDLFGCMQAIEKRCIICTLKEVENACANKNYNFSKDLISFITGRQV
ncbi:hypothetical protein [Vallitalea guaymasensis]|uniref:Uncharacterized protein n=1 Tax=Vallitalea guaymasensis TaxID=1185412 RepID=A0A8J8MAS9_9FIRM|nr:hypothetical protein [Vallitalea guaymasensis]QUH29551.1 hypothetical protein HYG85_11795 [Vallitalea guaymasensis]